MWVIGGKGAGSQLPWVTPAPAMVTPDSRGSFCNRTGTRLQSHRDSSWRCQGQGRKVWPGGTGPVADSKKTCNTHCSLEQRGPWRNYCWASWQGQGSKRTPNLPWDFQRTTSESVKFNPQAFPMLRPFYNKNVPLPSTPMLTVQGFPWSSRLPSGICCMDCPKGIYSQSFQLPLYHSLNCLQTCLEFKT